MSKPEVGRPLRWLKARVRALAGRLTPARQWLVANRAQRIDPWVSVLRGRQEREAHLNRYRFAACHALGTTALDVACGTGYGSALLRDGGAAFVLGIDLCPQAVAYAKRKYAVPSVCFTAADASRLPVPSETVDLIVFMEAIEHVGPEDLQDVFVEFGRVLKPDGRLLVSTSVSVPSANPGHSIGPSVGNVMALLAPRFRAIATYDQVADDRAQGHNGLLPAGLCVSTPESQTCAKACLIVAEPRAWTG